MDISKKKKRKENTYGKKAKWLYISFLEATMDRNSVSEKYANIFSEYFSANIKKYKDK